LQLLYKQLMKALFFDHQLELIEVPLPMRKQGQALIRVVKTGICNTDLEIMKGYMGFSGILGHEFVGVVEEADNPDLMGKRVVGEINVGCGKCQWCTRNMSRHCPNRTVVGILDHPGVFAEVLVLPDENLHLVPDAVSDECAVFTEPLAAALEIQEQIHVEPTSSICVIGDGKLGLLISWTLNLVSPDVTLIGKHPEKLALAEAKGVRCFIGEQYLNRRFDIVVESSGSASGWERAMSLAKPRGVIVLKSTYAGTLNVDLAPVVINELTIVGSRCGRFAPALAVLEKKLIDPTVMITGQFNVTDYQQAFSLAQEPHSLKVLINMP